MSKKTQKPPTADTMEHARDLKGFGARLKKLRGEDRPDGMTQAQMGEMLGKSRAAVTAWEDGANWCQPYDAKKLAKFFGITTDFLYFGITTGLTADQIKWLKSRDIEIE